MKHLILVIHTSVQQELADHLRTLEYISGFTFCQVEGHGVQIDGDPFLSARDKVVGYTPRARVDILLEDADVNRVLDSIRSTTQGIAGRGIYWVTTVEQNGHL